MDEPERPDYDSRLEWLEATFNALQESVDRLEATLARIENVLGKIALGLGIPPHG